MNLLDWEMHLNAFPWSTDIIQVLNEMPTDKRHIQVYHSINVLIHFKNAYRLFTSCHWTVILVSTTVTMAANGPFRKCQSLSFITVQKIRIKLSGDNLTWKTQKKDPFTSLYKFKANLEHWAEYEIFLYGALLPVKFSWTFQFSVFLFPVWI